MFFFANIFTLFLDFAKQKSSYKVKMFADSKRRAQEVFNDLSFVLFNHQTRGVEGGGQIDPPRGFQVHQQGYG